MLEKPKLKSADVSSLVDAVETNDREKDIERRLALLGEDDNIDEPSSSSSIERGINPMTMKAAESVEEKSLSNENLILFDKSDDESEKSKSEEVYQQIVPKKVIPSGNLDLGLPQALQKETPISPKKNALLARIMAAQQKAKLGQTSQLEVQSSISDSDGTTVHKSLMLKALAGSQSSEQDSTLLLTSKTTNSTSDKQQKVLADDDNNNDKGADLLPPPPPFENIEQLQKSKEEETFPPPFESVQTDILQFTGTPSAPPVEESCPATFDHTNHLDGVTPIMVSSSYFDRKDQDKNEEETDFAGFQLEGLSEDDKMLMMEEQRKIMEEIKHNTVENTASVVAARAHAFDLRSNVNAAAAVKTSNESASATKVTCGVSLDENSGRQSSEERTVNIGSGQKVALFGEGRTRDAIKDGTAILVECPNCQSWMQVAATATLMYCPLCSTVSPVMEQGEIMTKEELTQIENDRQLAERLQNMESVQEGQSSEESQHDLYQIADSDEKNKSWWDSISEALIPSTTTNEQAEKNHAAVSVSRPPGCSLHGVNTGMSFTAEENIDGSNLEQERLLGQTNHSSGNFRVAERKPLFSCVVDGISNTANVLGTTLGSNVDEDSNNVHGIDTTSLLAVPESTGRENLRDA